MIQPPTATGLRVRTARDAEVVFHAVALGILPMVIRRLDSEERMALCSGCVYVWEERTSNVSDSIDHGIERFTEGRSWGPSRARDDFLFYQEKDTAPKSMMVERTRALRYQEDPVGSYRMRPRRQGERMIKQTYSVYINGHAGMKKWHLNAYWTQETLDALATVDDFPQLRALQVPDGLYVCARTNRMRESASKARATPVSPQGFRPAPLPYALQPASPPASSATSGSPSPSWSSPPPLSAPPSWPSPSPSSSAPPSWSSPPPRGDRSLTLAPLEQLAAGDRSHRPRDAADVAVLRSLERRRSRW